MEQIRPPLDDLEYLKDPVLDLYVELKAKFKDLDEGQYLKLAAKVRQMIEKNPDAYKFIQYRILGKIMLSRAEVRIMQDPTFIQGGLKALEAHALFVAEQIIKKAKEIRSKAVPEKK